MTSPMTSLRLTASGLGLALGLGLLAVTTPTASAAQASAPASSPGTATGMPQVSLDHDRLPPGRTIRRYRVRPGDTPAGLAVRFHAWTAELLAINHLGPHGMLLVGQRIKIPVVDAAVPGSDKKSKKSKKDRSTQPGAHTARSPERERVRRVIARTARRHGVDPQLALAVAWQESGWQMDVTSSAQAIGAMQVLRPTGAWMSLYAGRDLRLRRTRDNAQAGVLLLRLLGQETRNRKRQIAAYYQGLGAVREHGLYDETRPYVRNVLAIKRRLERGQSPA